MPSEDLTLSNLSIDADSDADQEFGSLRPKPGEAPWYEIPDKKFISVEHPAVVKNEENAVRMLGGAKGVAKVFQPNPDNESEPNGLELRFRPGDALAPPVQGRPARTRAVLIKITVPKGKGPGPGWANGKDQDIPKALKGLKGKYKAEVIGHLDHSVRFRDMADYQWNTRNSKWAKNVEENLMELDLQALKRFRMTDTTTAREDTEIMRPPTFTHINYPHVYGFRQNPAIKVEVVNGEETLVNAGARVQTQTQYGDWSSETVPSSGGMNPPRGRNLIACVNKLEELFKERPIWTRRALTNSMPRELWTQLKWAYPHVAYYWRSGPWRDTYVKFGVDPRKDKGFAKYQVAAFKLEEHAKSSTKSWKHNKSHIFDGETVVPDGRVWQFCDMTEPLLKDLVDVQNFEARETCDRSDGWYPNNRHFKIKWIMRRKLSDVLAGKKTEDSVFEQILKEPDVVASGSVRHQTMSAQDTETMNVGNNNDADDLVRLDEDGEGVESDAEGEDFLSEIESEDEDDEEDGEQEEDISRKRGAGPGVPNVRDEKLQQLMKRFMEGQLQEGSIPAGGRSMPGMGDDFDILGDD